MPITSPGNDDDTGENHQPTLRKNTAEPVEQTLKQNNQRRAGSSLRPSRVTLTIGMYSKEGMPERSYHAARAYNQKWREEGIGEIRLVQTYKRTNVIFGLKKITLVRQWPYPASEPPYIKHFKTNEISEVTKIYISLLQHSTKKTAIYS